jgi:1-aminocyclopropane-1-carboxylate deaminase
MAINLHWDIGIDYLHDPCCIAQNIRLGILRLDKIHPAVSGNKWFKLSENLKRAQQEGCQSILTFGGAYSNHLAATAAAAHLMRIPSIGLVRGYHAMVQSSATMQFCASMGMQLQVVSREEYNRKYDKEYLDEIAQQYHQPFIIPEGGNNEAGRKGVEQIAWFIPPDVTHVATAMGTGTTFAGLANALSPQVTLVGFPAMKGGQYLIQEVAPFIQNSQRPLRVEDSYHFGGFAKLDAALIAFMNDFYQRHHIPLDFVYTAKMMFGILDMLKQGLFPPHSHIIAVHTGGLQGNATLSEKLLF